MMGDLNQRNRYIPVMKGKRVDLYWLMVLVTGFFPYILAPFLF